MTGTIVGLLWELSSIEIFNVNVDESYGGENSGMVLSAGGLAVLTHGNNGIAFSWNLIKEAGTITYVEIAESMPEDAEEYDPEKAEVVLEASGELIPEDIFAPAFQAEVRTIVNASIWRNAVIEKVREKLEKFDIGRLKDE